MKYYLSKKIYTLVGVKKWCFLEWQKHGFIVATIPGHGHGTKSYFSIFDCMRICLFKKLIESAVANAEQKQVIDVDTLFVKTVTVDQGPNLKRMRPRAQGRAFVVKKKMSQLNIVLDER